VKETFHLMQQILAVLGFVVGFGYQGKDILLRFIIEYSSLMDLGPWLIGLFLSEDF
jgi:hypothetical protein